MYIVMQNSSYGHLETAVSAGELYFVCWLVIQCMRCGKLASYHTSAFEDTLADSKNVVV